MSSVPTAAGPGQRAPVDAVALSDELEGKPLDQMLRRVTELFGPGRLAVSSAFGPSSLVIMHTLHALGIRLPVIFIDTLHHFPETLAQVEQVRQRYDLDLRVYRPEESLEAFEAKYGPRLWERDLDLYQHVSKVEPFNRATAELDGWITGRRRQQSETRAELPIAGGSPQVKINPLAGWSKSQVWQFILANQIPYNPLHDQGYASIGDMPLTTAVKEGEDERAGRWRGTGRTECGIHTQ